METKRDLGLDDEGIQIDGMVAHHWFDGSVMTIGVGICIYVLPSNHSSWQKESVVSGRAATGERLFNGYDSDRTKFWLNLDLKHEAVQSIRLEMTPWNPAMSTAREATATYLGSLGYDILRLHGTQVKGTIDGADVTELPISRKSVFKHPVYRGIGVFFTSQMVRIWIGFCHMSQRLSSVRIPNVETP